MAAMLRSHVGFCYILSSNGYSVRTLVSVLIICNGNLNPDLWFTLICWSQSFSLWFLCDFRCLTGTRRLATAWRNKDPWSVCPLRLHAQTRPQTRQCSHQPWAEGTHQLTTLKWKLQPKLSKSIRQSWYRSTRCSTNCTTQLRFCHSSVNFLTALSNHSYYLP